MLASEALRTLNKLGFLLQETTDQTSLAQNIVEMLEKDVGYEHLAILVAAEAGMQPLALSRQGQDAAFLEVDKIYVESRCSSSTSGLTNRVAQTGQSCRVGNVAEDPRYLGIRDDIRSELCVPLVVGREVIGVINTETTIPDAYDETDQRFLETAASQIALGITFKRRLGTVSGHGKRTEDHAPVTTCSYCKNLQVDQDHWISPEMFLLRRLGLLVTHGICPSCYERLEDSGFSE